jgi:hypothetical protein
METAGSLLVPSISTIATGLSWAFLFYCSIILCLLALDLKLMVIPVALLISGGGPEAS